MTEAYILDACRTPRGIGKIGKGALAGMHPQQLGATVLAALAKRNGLDSRDVDDVIWGVDSQHDKQASDPGRMSALDAGFDPIVSGVTLGRFCGSGITSVAFAAAQVKSGMEDLVIGGGAEMMSFTMSSMDPAKPIMLDRGNLSLRAKHPQSQQGVCADAIATLEGIDRDSVDRLALTSQQRAAEAMAAGRFDRSVVPVHDPFTGALLLKQDEFPRPQTTLDKLASLSPVFDRVAEQQVDADGTTYGDMIYARYPQLRGAMSHVHHAGNSSGVVDGAAALLMASDAYVKRSGATPRARVVATANMGDDPTLMLNGPVPAARKVLQKAGLSLDDIDLFEVNEAFAVVVEKFIRDLNVDRDRVNVNGGAIALGHPIGATGSVLIGTALDELERRQDRYALITMCAAGGMAPAIIIERL